MIRKNNKGFTLIEVLAVVVILGILSIMAVPKIFDMVTASREDIYIEDAKRLISQARYTMNAKSVKIEKPDNGECIVFSMKYLSVSDFQNPPNGGTYLPEGSFVVVKNVGGQYVYSVMLVEKTKDGDYRGVALATENALYEKNSSSLVRFFESNEVAYIDENTSYLNGGDVINSTYINRNLNKGTGDSSGDWVPNDSDIIGYYNNDEVEDEPLTDTRSPKVSAKFSSSGSLTTTLTVSATDADNASSELKVCVKISRNKDDSYPSIGSSYCEGYGGKNFYTKDINFGDPSNGGFSYVKKETAYIYIMVYDPSSNQTRKRLSYEIHENEKPVIISYLITNNNNIGKNLPEAKIYLAASDDMMAQEDLDVCFVQDNEKADSCSSYKKYSSVFDSKGYYNYTFKDKDGNPLAKPDGSSHTLKVFVKDSLGLVEARTLSYSIYKNQKPVIRDASLSAKPLKNMSSLDVTINFRYEDDITTDNKMMVKIEEDGTSNVKEMTFAQFMKDRDYTFAGKYDGKERRLVITITDEYGLKSDPVTLSLKSVYSNQKPVIEKFSIKSSDYACSGASSCYDTNYNGGNYDVEVTLTAIDDLDSAKDLLVCVSEVESDCSYENKDNTKKFIPYSSYNNAKKLSRNGLEDGEQYPTKQIVKKLYAAVIDSYGSYVKSNALEYKIYHNFEPSFSGKYEVNSASTSGNLSDVKFNFDNFSIVDDFDSYKARFCYKIDGGNDICTSKQTFTTLKTYLNNNFEFKTADGKALNYGGQTISTYIEVEDSYGLTKKTDVVDYELYSDNIPEIRVANFESSEKEYQSNVLKVTFSVADFQDTYSVCITGKEECGDNEYFSSTGDYTFFSGDMLDGGDYPEYVVTFDAHKKEGWTSDYSEENTNKVLRIFIKDSHGNIVSREVSYEVYHICSNVGHIQLIDENPVYTHEDDGAGVTITAEHCGGACYHNLKTSNVEGHRNNWAEENTITGRYKKSLKYQDLLVNQECTRGDDVDLFCDFVDCFSTGTKTTTNRNFIGLQLFEPNLIWTYSSSKVTDIVDSVDPWCSNPPGNQLFYEGDYRCGKNSSGNYNFCEDPEGTPVSYCNRVVELEKESVVETNENLRKSYEAEVKQREDSIKEAQDEAIEVYNEKLETYHANLSACQAAEEDARILWENDRRAALEDYLALLRAENRALEAKCEILKGYTAEQIEELVPICNMIGFCNQLELCLNPPSPSPSSTDTPQETPRICIADDETGEDEETPIEDDENVFRYTSADVNMCGDVDYNEEDYAVPCDILNYQTACIEHENYDEEEDFKTKTEQFYERYGQFEYKCEFEMPEYPNLEEIANGFPEVPDPEYIVIDEQEVFKNCYGDAKKQCADYLDSFCLREKDDSGNIIEKPNIQRKYKVSCDNPKKTDGPYWCRKSGIAGELCFDGYDDNTCSSNDKDCVETCYRDIDCSESSVENPKVFVCQGYFKVYQSFVSGDDMHLQETGMKVCPDFYRKYPDFYAFDVTKDEPYVRFNQKEVEVAE